MVRTLGVGVADDYRKSLYGSYVSGHQGDPADAFGRDGLIGDVLPHLPRDRNALILDLGCGRGQLVRMLRDHGYLRVKGIDISAEQVALARQLGSGDVERDDLFGHAARHPARYDAVVAIDVVEHFDRPDVEPVFRALSTLLRPGGVLVLRTPNGSSPFAGRMLYSDLTHGVIYTERSLRQIGAITGFATFAGYAVRPERGGGPKRAVRRIVWRIIEGILIVPLIVETGTKRHIVTQNLLGVGQTHPQPSIDADAAGSHPPA